MISIHRRDAEAQSINASLSINASCSQNPFSAPQRLGGEFNEIENSDIPREWLEEFEAAARRPLKQRMKYAFIRTYKPVLDDEPYRAFDSMQEYRRWCEENLPEWLGYGRD